MALLVDWMPLKRRGTARHGITASDLECLRVDPPANPIYFGLHIIAAIANLVIKLGDLSDRPRPQCGTSHAKVVLTRAASISLVHICIAYIAYSLVFIRNQFQSTTTTTGCAAAKAGPMVEERRPIFM